MSRIHSVLAALALLTSLGCSRPTPQPVLVDVPGPSIDPQADDGSIPPPREVVQKFPAESFERGVAYLLKQQSPDGAWRSDVVGLFKDGTALTPLALVALQNAADAGLDPAGSAAARKKASAWLAKFARADGTIDAGPDGLEFPLYTGALSVKALSHAENAIHLKARDAWLKFLLERQLTEKLGWKPDEKQYGGWGYCRVLPRKPEPNVFAPNNIESNLSATVFALDALRSAGVKEETVYAAAAVFVRRCQNWSPLQPKEPLFAWGQYQDGGFHFIYDDPTRNKAGQANDKPRIFHSYGSTTADGLRALTLCGITGDDRRRKVARDWLVREFHPDRHPGKYVPAHESNRDAVYFYYAASVSRAFRDYKVTLPDGSDWALELAAALRKRQRADGSWVNPVELVREHDPIVATSNAVSALANCKR